MVYGTSNHRGDPTNGDPSRRGAQARGRIRRWEGTIVQVNDGPFRVRGMLEGTLHFSVQDPLALTLECGTDLRWVFARSIFLEALGYPTSQPLGASQDVVLRVVDEETVQLHLRSRTGHVAIQMDVHPLRRFLEETLALVPATREAENPIVREALDGWFGSTFDDA